MVSEMKVGIRRNGESEAGKKQSEIEIPGIARGNSKE